ncbi:MAG: hypothetical protein FJX35_18740 [Alphaproteobacteria bacterium]|nr:hypothetical protein [Alphaproteobacteria bacterium]
MSDHKQPGRGNGADGGRPRFVLSDPTAIVGKVDLSGRTRHAKDVHGLSLADLAGEYATIVDVAWVESQMRR